LVVPEVKVEGEVFLFVLMIVFFCRVNHKGKRSFRQAHLDIFVYKFDVPMIVEISLIFPMGKPFNAGLSFSLL
jgi:hypothetical protein